MTGRTWLKGSGDGREAGARATGRRSPGGAPARGTVSTSRSNSSRDRQASRSPPSAYRIRSSAVRPGGPKRSFETRTSTRCPTISRPSFIHARRLNSSRSAAIWVRAPARRSGKPGGSSTTSPTPAFRTSAASLCKRSPSTAAEDPRGSPGGRSSRSKSTALSCSSRAAIDRTSSIEAGARTTSQFSRTPCAAASIGSRLRPRSR